MRDTPTITTGGNTANRLSEGHQIGAYGNGPSHDAIKTMPGSTTNTKRNSIAANIVSSEKSMRGSANKNADAKRARNSDQLRTKQQSRHKRKTNAGLSAT